MVRAGVAIARVQIERVAGFVELATLGAAVYQLGGGRQFGEVVEWIVRLGHDALSNKKPARRAAG